MDSVPPRALEQYYWPSGLVIPNYVLATAKKGSYYPILQPSPLYNHIDYMYCKGPAEDLKGEMGKLISGSVNYDLTEIERAMKAWIRNRVPVKVAPSDYEICVRQKDLKSSVGMPWKFYFPDYSAMVDEFTYEGIANIMEEFERNILEGKPYISFFYLFSKLDKYSASKVETSSYRSIQVADVLVLFLMQKYFATVIKQLEVEARQMFLITDIDSYALRTDDHRQRYTFGVDFTAYDKTESSDLMRTSFRILCSRVQIPQRIADFIENAVCAPVYLIPLDGTPIYASGGSNPSGQYLTSVMNTLNHIIMNSVCVHEALGVPFDEYLENASDEARMVATGDDGIESFDNLSSAKIMMEAYPPMLYNYFGIVAKIDGVTHPDGSIQPFPPGVLPPYLSTVEWQIPGGQAIIPCRPNRVLATLQYVNIADAQIEGLYDEKIRGVSVCLSGFDNVIYSDPTYPIPQAYFDFRTVMQDHGIVQPTTPWERMMSLVELQQHCGSNRDIAIMKAGTKKNKQIAAGIANIVANKVAATVNKKKKRRNRPRKAKKQQQPRQRARRHMMHPAVHSHISKLYMDPEGKTRPPVTDQSYGNMTPVSGVQRVSLPSSTTQDTYVVFQWTPTDLRGVYVVNDGTWNIGTISIPQITNNPPFGVRPLRMSVEVCNTTSYTQAVGQVLVAMSPQQIVWKNLLHADGLHFTAGGITDLNSFVSSFVKTQVYAAADFISPKKWVFYPVSSVGYHEWMTYGPTNYTSFGNGYLQYLVPGAENDALSTMIVKLASTSAINNYVLTVRVQEACRYPLNTVLGNIGVHQDRAPAAVIQQIHRSAADTGHAPVKGGAGGTSDYQILPTITKYAKEGNDTLRAVGGFANTAYNFGRGLKGIWDTFTAAAPIVEELGPELGLLAAI